MKTVMHQHREFVDTIIDKVNTYSHLVSLRFETRSMCKTGDWHFYMRKEAEALLKDIENSLYRKLDEARDL